MNIRQANGIGRVHVAKPQMKLTYCGRPVDEEDWVTTSKEANCTGCVRAGRRNRRVRSRHGADRHTTRRDYPDTATMA